jgi:hypothetical protein
MICIAFALLLVTVANVESFSIQTVIKSREFSRNLEMKGKGSRVPIDQRGEYLKQQKMMEARKQMQETPKDVPIFEVYVRPKAGGQWIPCGNLAGDSRATALVNAWMSGFLTDTYKSQLDQGLARSIFAQEDAFVQGVIENYKPFKRFKKEDLTFGYKVKFEGLEAKVGEQKVTEIVKGMEKGWLDNIKDGFSGMFGGDKN